MTPTPDLRGRHVLLVEDEYLVASFMADAFDACGACVVGPAASVADAMSLLASDVRVDAAVLDVNLGGEPVFPVADRLRERGVPILFTSGYDASTFPERYRDTPMCLKPIDIEHVTGLIAGLPGAGPR